jgi:hypothetical protein
MKKLTDNLFAVIVPDDAYNFDFVNKQTKCLHFDTVFIGNFSIELNHPTLDKFTIIGEITKDETFDFDCEKYVKPKDEAGLYYHYIHEQFFIGTAEYSFITLLQDNDIFIENLKDQKILIIEKVD